MMRKVWGVLLALVVSVAGIYFVLSRSVLDYPVTESPTWIPPASVQKMKSGIKDILNFTQNALLMIPSVDNFIPNLTQDNLVKKKSDVEIPQKNESKVGNNVKNTRNVTIVTAYWNLGTFQKGVGGLKFSTNTYFKWASTFKFLVNPLVVYTDCKEFKELMETLRSDRLNNTMIYLLNRTELWPFQLVTQMKSVLDQTGYPKYYPNTVIPEYPAAQHSKYAVVAETIRKGVFTNPYFAWLDIGYFRDVVERKVDFTLDIPPGFDPGKISVNRVEGLSMNIDPFTIFRKNIVWVGGGIFLGKGEALLQFEQLYHRAVKYFLDQQLVNSDQQVLYSMYSKKGREALKPNIELQLYIPKGSGNPWFYLGYLCRKEVSVRNS
ncbi:uncharacterized protein LOC128165736 [Crassostrea angulata]|uniref:uncharacterized protein LOC128165736 n=1 Tax=Magallana angulata TaxID=2784310 RepID=UPI0022B0ED08|nr:uncharacterized protein LOC128165736 [Crassostrea angulata]